MRTFLPLRVWRKRCRAIALLVSGFGMVYGQQPRAGLPDELGRLARPFRTVEAVRDDSDLAAWKALAGRARVVSLGESKHGAHEWLALRNRLFYFLVERCGFTAIALESGFPEARPWLLDVHHLGVGTFFGIGQHEALGEQPFVKKPNAPSLASA